MALFIVCCSTASALWRVSDSDISTEVDLYDAQRMPQSLEAFMRTIWIKLPPELEHMVFRQVVNQLTSERYAYMRHVSKLSLSSRAWSQIFRPLVFKEIHFMSDSDSEAWAGLRQLYSILNSSTSQSLPDQVHTIVCRPSTAIHDPIFAALLRRLRGLRELSLYSPTGGITDQPVPLLWRQHVRSLRSLQSLYMVHCYFPTFSGLLRLLGGLPSL